MPFFIPLYFDMVRIYENIELAARNSFGVPARAKRLVEFDEAEDLMQIFADPTMTNEQWVVLAGGNNTLFTRDFEGTLICPQNQSIEIVATEGDTVHVRIGAGVEWDDAVAWSVEQGLWGIENLSLIPGKAGAAPVQNIGAYGTEVKDVIEQVEMFCPETRNTLILANEYCEFGYRDSIFKRSLRGRVIITSIVIRLSRTPNPRLRYGDVQQRVDELGGPTLANIREAIVAIRSHKLPDTKVTGNAGSFFKNPVVERELAEKLLAEYPDMPLYPAAEEGKAKLAAGWLIDRAGWKGKSDGRVGVHARQALVLINLGGATGAEVMALAHRIVGDVKERFGVELSPEVNVL